MLVFRDGRQTVSGRERLRDLIEVVRGLPADTSFQPESLLDALLRAGELECALADAGSEAARSVARVTDALAEASVGLPASQWLGAELEALLVPERLQVSTPEGFAYYALHPLNYADLAARLECGRTAVVGIRSIGTTLSAICTAALRREGLSTSRITVRPTGHPFDRRLELGVEQASWVRSERNAGSEFWVVDEGPGLSGSSFLSVAEALERNGVPAGRIRLLCAAPPRVEQMLARDAPARWARYNVHAVAAPWRKPAQACDDLSGGQWRSYFGMTDWPASWAQFERAKFVSEDGRRLCKFEGFGRFGKSVAERAQRIADGGFGPPPRQEDDGFFSYALIGGNPASSLTIDSAVLERLAGYCAFRAAEFAAPVEDGSPLEHMMAWNHFEEFGQELEAERRSLPVVRPVIVDGRMQPHEWIAGEWLLKTDGASHGDDHFFPGPTDIAWDLAGTIVEWPLGGEATDYFMSRYERLSGDRVHERLPAYLLAYTVFRLGYCKMAANAMAGSDEESRLRRDYERYRAIAAQMTDRAAAA